jgi:hypothetical protein
MRFLVAGLVLIAVGIGLTEYSRRHAEAPTPSSVKKKKPAAITPASTKALIETVTAQADVPGDANAFAKALSGFASDLKADGFATVLSGSFAVRDLKGSGQYAAAIITAGELGGLVRITPGGSVTPAVARKSPITALAIDGSNLWWAEGNRVFSVGTDGVVQVRTQFAIAQVTSLAALEGTVIVTLVPTDADPFSTEASGAVVKLEAGGTATLVASEQVRPHDVLLHGSDVFFIAGYPSALVRAALDGSFSAQIADRADGPLAFDGEGLVHRVPKAGAPEVRRVAPAGGAQVILAHGDIDWLAASNGVTRYTTVGIGARLYEVVSGQDPKEIVAFKGVARGLALVGEQVVLSATGDDGTTVLRVK